MAKETSTAARKSAPAKTRAARAAQSGDIAPRLGPVAIERHVVRQATLAKQDAQGAALRDLLRRSAKAAPGETLEALQAMLAGASADDVAALRDKGTVA